MRNRYLIILLFLLICGRSFPQQIIWNAGLFSFFDNTEFAHSSVQIPQTMAGVRFAPDIGLSWDSIHSVITGFNVLHEFGSEKSFADFYPTAYYRFKKKPFLFFMGAFPRDLIPVRYPRLFFQDSIYYYRPNVNGLMWEYSEDKLNLSVWLDWTGRQSFTEHETFFWGVTGKYKPGVLYVQHFSYMFHFAGTMNPADDGPLHDNGLAMTSLGLDLSGKTFFDKFDINGGWVIGLDRARAYETGWLTHNAFISQANIEYKHTGLFNTFYIGDPQMYYYNELHNELYWGDPFYRSKVYNRTDFYIDFIRNKNINTRLTYSLHFSEGKMYHEQGLKVNVNLNGHGHNP